MYFFIEDPLAFGIIMQLKTIKINIEKVLKYRFIDSHLEDILCNMINTGIMDLIEYTKAPYTADTYVFFQTHSRNNVISYYDFYRYSLQLEKYCYEHKLFTDKDPEYFMLK